MAPPSSSPAVSVLICTRNRGDAAVAAVASALACSGPAREIIVVDQSDGEATRGSLAPFAAREEIRYVAAPPRGVSAARNLGIGLARAEHIALTDDDCVVDPGWLERLTAAFDLDPRIGIVYGSVLAAPCDAARGFIPAYRGPAPVLVASVAEKHRAEGIGASMGLSKDAWRAVGGFDEAMGPGAPLLSAEELDLALRALQAGFAIQETPEAVVLHHGFRTWEQGQDLLRAHLYGIGAMFAKQFKGGRWEAAAYLYRLARRWLLEGPVVDFGGWTPGRGLRLGAFVRGFWAGLRRPVDGSSLCFATVSAGAPPRPAVVANPPEATRL